MAEADHLRAPRPRYSRERFHGCGQRSMGASPETRGGSSRAVHAALAAYARIDFQTVLGRFGAAAEAAQLAGLGVNAGHDLNLQNVGQFCRITGILEVSIGHALVSDALEVGLYNAVRAYLQVLASSVAAA